MTNPTKRTNAKIKEDVQTIKHDLYGNGSTGAMDRIKENERKILAMVNKYDRLNNKLNILIVVLVLSLGENLGVLKFLGALFKL